MIWTIRPDGVLLDTRFLGNGMVRGHIENIALVPGWMLIAGTTYDTLPGQSTAGGLDVFLGALKE